MKTIILLASLISATAFSVDKKKEEKPKEKAKEVQIEQPMCGTTRICEMKKDKKGNPYCICQGRQGRAKLQCCKEKKR